MKSPNFAKQSAKIIFVLTGTLIASGCDQSTTSNSKPDTNVADVVSDTGTTSATPNVDVGKTTSTFRGEVWGDNWSSMYLGETLVMEDSTPLTTERSFNAEVFTFEAERPFLLNVVMKDYTTNESGLEYIGANNQQMGDGGYIAQIKDVATGDIVAVSNADWKCLTINKAPLDKSCENSSNPLEECTWEIVDEPVGWKADDFDDSAWTSATVHSAQSVSPKDGYNEITWDPSAQLIWGPDLETDNTILCRVRVK